MDFIVDRFYKLFVVWWITSKGVALAQQYRPSCVLTSTQCPNKNITFFLYTRATRNFPIQLDMYKSKKVLSEHYVKHRPLIVILHGYTGNHNFAPNDNIRPAFFDENDFNIISVDYEPLAREPCYPQSVQNLPTVANCTAQLLDFLIDWKIFSLESIHVIGFSLGAQTSGMIANFLKYGRKLKRITGLDPAKPLFVFANNEHRLDQNDAEFVDIIHTDVFQRGILLPSGHVDFYANGGFDQPGCENKLYSSSCNHVRATQFYAESINPRNEKKFWGFKCAHWYLYAIGMCIEEETNAIAEMGYNANTSSRGLYFLTTNEEIPFARGSNFSTNTVLPAENIEPEPVDQVFDCEITID